LLHASQPQSSKLGRWARPGHPISGNDPDEQSL